MSMLFINKKGRSDDNDKDAGLTVRSKVLEPPKQDQSDRLMKQSLLT